MGVAGPIRVLIIDGNVSGHDGVLRDTPNMTNAAADPHVCTLPRSPHTSNAQGQIDCPCGRRGRLEHYQGDDGSYLGSSWILEVDR